MTEFSGNTRTRSSHTRKFRSQVKQRFQQSLRDRRSNLRGTLGIFHSRKRPEATFRVHRSQPMSRVSPRARREISLQTEIPRWTRRGRTRAALRRVALRCVFICDRDTHDIRQRASERSATRTTPPVRTTHSTSTVSAIRPNAGFAPLEEPTHTLAHSRWRIPRRGARPRPRLFAPTLLTVARGFTPSV